MVDQLAHLITSPPGVLAICSAIFLWAMIAYLVFQAKVRPIIRDVFRAVSLIEQYEGEQELVDNFEDFHESMRDIPRLWHTWSEFDETLIKDRFDDQTVIHNARSPEEFFSRSAVVGDQVNLRFFIALPNLLTGSGILGTFVGLVAGIALASDRLGAEQIEIVKAALQDLLGGASLAFLTSIAGLVSSILFSWGEKHLLHRLDAAIRQWNKALDERLNRVTSERLAAEQLIQGRQQIEVLTQFTTDLAFQIADAFQDRLSQSMGPTLNRLVDAVEGMRKDHAEHNDESLKGMLEQFSDSLSGAAGKELMSLGTTLEKLSDRLDKQVVALTERQGEMEESSRKNATEIAKITRWSTEKLQTGVQEALANVVSQIGGLSSNFGDQMQKAGEALIQRMEVLGENIDKASTELRLTVQSSAQVASQYQQVLTETKGLVSDINSAVVRIQGLNDPISLAAEEFKQSSAQMQLVAGQVGTFSEKIGDSVADIQNAQKGLQENWANYLDRFEGVDSALASTIEELAAGVENYSSRIREYVQGLDSHTSSIVRDLASASSELSESVETLAEVLGKVSP
jgi:methyl-accepting chemotaxis protein